MANPLDGGLSDHNRENLKLTVGHSGYMCGECNDPFAFKTTFV